MFNRAGILALPLPDGRLRVKAFSHCDAATIAPDGTVARTGVPELIGPATSSGAVNVAGEILQGFKPDGSADVFRRN